MGVNNLWELLAPVGRRVSVETLAGKKLAIDASIWMIQFMKAMRDEKGEMVRNAHILGFFRRICKLLFLRTKPVFVFDGATPVLKRRTVIARRRQRENAQAKIRKTAEKLLLNHLKAIRLKELAKDLENQRQKNDAKGKRKITDKTDIPGTTPDGTETVPGSYNQEAIDEMLAASLAAEDNESLMHHASTSAAGIPYEEEDNEEDEEMILPTMHGKVDPAVLAALPPSMQLDLLVQMRERLMAENRQKYQKVKKAPERFSELQIQAYLKTVAFRRDIDEVRKSAVGRGIGGVQTSRIASEANREFIFSSSFSGDKQVLTSVGLEKNSSEQQQIPMVVPPSDTSDGTVSTKKSNASGTIVDDSRNVINDDVETYLDERGRVRVSRVRAMGFRMTRDLQRNLDLMKEIEEERLGTVTNTSNNPLLYENTVGVSRKLPSKIQLVETSDQGTDEPVFSNNRNEEFVNRYGTSIEVSFEDNGEHTNAESDDDWFTHLVAGDSDMLSSADNIPLKKQSSGYVSDCEWEEGVMEDNNNTLNHDLEFGNKPSLAEGHERHESELEWEEGSVDIHMHASSCQYEYKEAVTTGDNNESEVEWEDGSSDIPGLASSCPPEFKEVISKGAMEEEVNFQEAIRMSLEDLRCHKSVDSSSEGKKLNRQEIDSEGTCFGTVCEEKDLVEPKVSLQNVLQPNESTSEVSGGAQRVDGVSGVSFLRIDNSPSIQLSPSMEVKHNNMEVLVARAGDSYLNIHSELGKNSVASGKLCGEIGHEESVTPAEEEGVGLVEKLIMCTSSLVGRQVPTGTNYSPGISSHVSDSLSVDMHDVTPDDARLFEFKTPEKDHLKETAEPIESLVMDSIDNFAVQKLIERENDKLVNEKDDFIKKSALREATKERVEITEASLEEEIQNLDKERTTLGDEQKRLERNAESVSSEMFTECQELLQMFGLPYIIAPMEAEAQCAYMELENLVDGVVTDDSDVFLFGGRSVYKNIFDDRKYVETYFMKDIENELGLTREKLIRMALLLGSDYTEGVSGIGIVNAIEVVNAFPEEDGLRKFREWIESPDPAILGKVDLQAGSSSRKRGSKIGHSSMDSSNSDVEGGVSASDQHALVTDLHKMKQKFMDKHRNVSKNWHIPSSFPSEAVISAYDSPQVDKATEPFSWGKPDLFVLRKLCWEKFGWGTQKADELLLPVLKEYSKHETQLRLETFYTFNERFAKIRSKRIKKAVKGTTRNKSSNLMDDTLQDVSKSRKKRKVRSNEAGFGDHDSRSDYDVARDETNSTEEPAAKQSRKRRIHREPSPSEVGNSEPSIQAVGRKNTKRGSSVGGKGIGRSAGRGRGKKRSSLEYTEISTDDGNNSETEQEVPVENYNGSHVVRRSTRPRKAVKYTMNDLDIDESGKANQDSGDSADEVGEDELLEDAGIVGVGGAAASLSKNKVGDPSLVESLSKGYIEMDGGICMDEAEPNTGTGQVSLDQTGDPLLDAELSQENLRMGGGFCLDEDKIDKNSGKSAYSPAREILSENDYPSHCSGFGEEAEHDISYDASQSVSDSIRTVGELQVGGHTDAPYVMQNVAIPDCTNTIHDNHSNLAISHENIEGNDSGAKSTRFLSAMPNLRRKRRS